MGVHHPFLAAVIIAPDPVQQLQASQNPSLVLHQHLQQLKLLGRQLQRLCLPEGLIGLRIEPKIAQADLLRVQPAAAAQKHVDFLQQNLPGKAGGQHLLGTGLVDRQLLLLGVGGPDCNDRDPLIHLPDVNQYIPAATSVRGHIQHDQIRMADFKQPQGSLAVFRLQRSVAVPADLLPDSVPELSLRRNQQYFNQE